MPRPAVFMTPTTLYHPTEGKKVFPAGETDPGPSWWDSPTGPPVGGATTAQALNDLIAAQDQLEAAERRAQSHAHDMAQLEAAKSAAEARVADLEQARIAAEQARDELAAECAGFRGRLTNALQTVAALQARLAAFDHDGDGIPGGSLPVVDDAAEGVETEGDIPEDWRSAWHWKTKVKRAKAITGRDDITSVEDAEPFIEAAYETQKAKAA